VNECVRALWVTYDAHCGLCSSITRWIEEQPKLVPLTMVPAQAPASEVVVVSDRGHVWSGDHAFVVILWALREYRALAMRLANPALLPMARAAFAALSGARGAISSCFGLRGAQ
jgi:predicted DCC family thiol-disulfide oxidoreductase YuxK